MSDTLEQNVPMTITLWMVNFVHLKAKQSKPGQQLGSLRKTHALSEAVFDSVTGPFLQPTIKFQLQDGTAEEAICRMKLKRGTNIF